MSDSTVGAVLCLAALLNGALAMGQVEHPVFDVPEVAGVAVDGSSEDWGDRGFRVEMLTGLGGRVLPPADFDARFRLGWDERGLLLVVTICDDVAAEHENVAQLHEKDCVEVFVAEAVGSGNRYQVIVTSGADPAQKGPRKRFYDRGPAHKTGDELTMQLASRITDEGQVIEALLPWENLGITPHAGMELGFQIYASDSDDPPGRVGDRLRLVWYPSERSADAPDMMHRLRLASRPGPAVTVAVGSEMEVTRGRVSVSAYGTADQAGNPIVVQDGEKVLASGELRAEGGRAAARFLVPMPPVDENWGEPLVITGEGQALPLPLEDPGRARARAFMGEPIVFDAYCFAGAEFPGADFEHPLQVGNLIGQYEIETDYYDAGFNRVTRAEDPGRYGAVVTITPEHGRPTRRFRTLYRQLAPLPSWPFEMDVSVQLPLQLGIDPAVTTNQARVIRAFFTSELRNALGRDEGAAAFLAGLREARPDDPMPDASNDVWAANRQWWVTMKRKLYGVEEAFPGRFVCPRPIEGDPAPVVREGTPEEAGMDPGASARIDSICKEWAQRSGEAFGVCVVRHGVVVLHDAYGDVGSRPMRVTDRTWMASVTKVMSAALMMMLVDQGLVDLDEPIDSYLPAMRGIDVPKPLTVRHLWNHVSGLSGHWGDPLHDYEEVIACYYPHLEVAERFEYGGAGCALGGKVIETVTGEALPQFHRRHLLDPLGLEDTRVTGSYADAESVPLDMAKFGQMLLNGGSYGDKRFFSKETFQKMLPAPLPGIPDDENPWEVGIGTWWMRGRHGRGRNLSDRAFGHEAASSATFIVDPEKDLVIVVTRNRAGRNFEQYHERFLDAVVDGIAEAD
ncbi:MAG: serine hydrolase [Planctomycetota bacterium]